MQTRYTSAKTPMQRSRTAQADVADLVLAEPQRIWRGTEIADATQHSLLEVMVALAIMTKNGRIERVAAGDYRAAPSTPASGAERIQVSDDANK